MGKSKRIKAQRGEFVRGQKQPTGTYQSAKDRRDERRRQREALKRIPSIVERLAASVKGDDRG